MCIPYLVLEGIRMTSAVCHQLLVSEPRYTRMSLVLTWEYVVNWGLDA